MNREINEHSIDEVFVSKLLINLEVFLECYELPKKTNGLFYLSVNGRMYAMYVNEQC